MKGTEKHSDRGTGEERLDDFATICLQLPSSVLCGRTGGWWPPYFCWLQPFLSPPFSFLYLLPALFIPLRPHAAQLAGVAVRSQSQPSSPLLLLHIHITCYRKGHGRSQPSEMGEQRSISIFYRCYLSLELSDGGEGLSFDFRGQVGRTEVCVFVCAHVWIHVGIRKQSTGLCYNLHWTGSC